MGRSLAGLAIALLGAACWATPARADETPRWLFLPVLSGDKAKTLEAAALSRELEAALRAKQQPMLTNASAAGLFEASHSAEPVQLGSDELKRLSQKVSQAARYLALGELADAQRALESVQALADPARDYLNRDSARARKVFDNCVMVAYLRERANEHQPALRQMLECSRGFPSLRPEGRAYPAELRRLFEEASQQLSQMQPSTLRIVSLDARGCTVRVNGTEVGKSPLTWSEARSTNPRVQVECEAGRPGRIHGVELKSGDNELVVDPAFEAAVHSGSGLWLGYPNDREREQRAASDAQAVALALGVRVVMLWTVPGPLGVDVALRPLGDDGPGHELARAGFSSDSGYAADGPSKLVNALLAWARSRQAETSPPPSAAAAAAPAQATVAAAEPAPPKAARSYSQQHAAAGAILAAVGGVSCAVSWFAYAERQPERKAVDGTSDVNKYKKLGVAAITTAAVGNSLLSVSEYFWLPDDPGVPALAWAIGALGLGMGATAIVLSFTVSDCQLGDTRLSCQHFWSDHFFGPMLLLHSLPLMTAPLWYGLRVAFRPAGVQVGFSGEGLSVHGMF